MNASRPNQDNARKPTEVSAGSTAMSTTTTTDGDSKNPDLPGSFRRTAVVVDQLALFRLGLVQALSDCSVDVIGSVSSLSDGIRLAKERSADVLIVGKHPDLKRRKSLREIKKHHDTLRILIFLHQAELADVAKLIGMGIDGLLLRSASVAEFSRAVERTLMGERFVAAALAEGAIGRIGPLGDPESAEVVDSDVPERERKSWGSQGSALRDDESGESDIGVDETEVGDMGDAVSHALTAREREVLAELATGASYDDIAEALIVTRATVKTHLVHIYDKLGVRNRQEAVARALALGLLG